MTRTMIIANAMPTPKGALASNAMPTPIGALASNAGIQFAANAVGDAVFNSSIPTL